ncbi:MAG: hypothetical protein JW850_15175 [Thermoflexales bacterium]|nr:hypothetical protein [Thermoflexales bacterium]
MKVTLRQIIDGLPSLRKLTTAPLTARALSIQLGMIEKAIAPALDSFNEGRGALYRQLGIRPGGEPGQLLFAGNLTNEQKFEKLDELDRQMKEIMKVEVELAIGELAQAQVKRTGVSLSGVDDNLLDWIIEAPTPEELAAMEAEEIKAEEGKKDAD